MQNRKRPCFLVVLSPNLLTNYMVKLALIMVLDYVSISDFRRLNLANNYGSGWACQYKLFASSSFDTCEFRN